MVKEGLFDINFISSNSSNENTNKTFDAIHTISAEVKTAEKEISKLNRVNKKHQDDNNDNSLADMMVGELQKRSRKRRRRCPSASYFLFPD